LINIALAFFKLKIVVLSTGNRKMEYEGYIQNITPKRLRNLRAPKFRVNYDEDFTVLPNGNHLIHSIDLGAFDDASLNSLKANIKKSEHYRKVYSITDLPSFVSGPNIGKHYMIKRAFKCGYTRDIRYVNDESKFAFFSATLTHLLALGVDKNATNYVSWKNDIIVTCFGMWVLAKRNNLITEKNPTILFEFWRAEAVKFFRLGYTVSGETWLQLGTVGDEPLLDPNYNFIEDLAWLETSDDRKKLGLEL